MENQNNNPHTILYIIIALVVGILIGTYIPKVIQNQQANDNTGKVFQTREDSPSAGTQNAPNRSVKSCKYDDECPVSQVCSDHFPKSGSCIPYSSQ